MENRSNYVIVGSVVLALVVGIFVMVIWLARFSGEDDREYDIFFKQAITGLSVGSPVAFSGVSVGKVTEIRLLPDTPQFVRVRIAVQDDVPILKGTTAAVEGLGFTGVSQIQLSGAMQGADPITEKGPYGVPVIPPRSGALGQLLASAPELLNNVSRLTGRLSDILDDRNQKSIANILTNVDRTTDALATRAPEIAATITEARATLRAATTALETFEGLAGSTQALVDSEGKPMIIELRAAVKQANATLARLDGIAASAQPGIDTLSNQTIPEVNQLVRELKETSTALGAVAARLDEDPAGALVGGRTLPDYKPGKRPQEANP